jgi:polygalacturonase
MKNKIIIVLSVILLFSTGCRGKQDIAVAGPGIPVLAATTAASAITGTTATSGGDVTGGGGAGVTARGVCWSTSPNPTTTNSKTTDGTGTGTFTSSITGLTASTLYYARAYASNSAGTGYGAPVSFTTLADNIINVKNPPYNAAGNGSTDDTGAIQAAINACVSGGTVFVPDGTYMIQQKFYGSGNNNNGNGRWLEGGVELKSNMTFKMSSGAVLKEITNNSGAYAIINIRQAQNVNVIGGTVQGDRATHYNNDGWDSANDYGGQDGNGISIEFSQNIYIEGVRAIDCWGDGFMMGGDYGGVWGFVANKNITFDSVVADNNRRQGLSIIAGETVAVKNSVFKNTHGHAPQAGIDIEPNVGKPRQNPPDGMMTTGDIVKDVLIVNNQFMNNNGAQIDVFSWQGQTSNVTITGNTFATFYGAGPYGGNPNYNWNYGIGTRLDTRPAYGGVMVTNNWIGTGNIGIQIGPDFGAAGNTITGNHIGALTPIKGNQSGNTVSNNTLLVGSYPNGYPGAP